MDSSFTTQPTTSEYTIKAFNDTFLLCCCDGDPPTLAGLRKLTGLMTSVLFLGGRNHMQDLGSRYGMNVFPFYPEREGGGE